MIQDVSQKIYKALTKRLGTTEPIPRQAVDSAELPSPLRSYLLAVLDREAERVADTVNSQRDVWIAESVDVRRSRTAFAVAASRNVQIPSDRIDEVLRRASDVVLRYLIRPSTTLQGTIFDRAEPSLDVEEILERMRMFSAYPYFQEVLRHYFAEKDIEHVDRARLDSVLHRIDRQMTSDFTPEEWAEMLTPLFDTLAMDADYERGIPVELLRVFFREKELGVVLLRLDDFEDQDLLSKDELVEALNAPAPEAAQEPQPAAEEVEEQKRPPTRSAPEGRPAPARAEEAEDSGLVPLWKQFQRGPTATPPQRPREAPEKPAESDVPMWQRFRSGQTSQPASPPQKRQVKPPSQKQSGQPSQGERPAPSSPPSQKPRAEAQQPSELIALEKSVLGERGAPNRRMFIRQLFNGSEADYREALERIGEATSWAEASRIIAKDVFRRFDVNIYDEAAVGFTDMVEARFEQQRTR